MAMSLEEKRKRDRDHKRAVNHAAAIAAGRVPGRPGQPPKPMTEERIALLAERAKRKAANFRKWRSKKRAEQAIAAGRIPGKPGTKRVLVTDEMVREAANRRAKAWRLRNLERVRQADLARNLIRMPRLKEENPVACRLSRVAIAAAARAKQAGGCSPQGLTAIVRRVWERANGHCAACSVEAALELDHIVAVINGGDNSEGNFQFLCMPCNRSKGAKDFNTWLHSRQMAA